MRRFGKMLDGSLYHRDNPSVRVPDRLIAVLFKTKTLSGAVSATQSLVYILDLLM